MTAILGAWPLSGFNKFDGEEQAQNYHVIQYYCLIAKEISSTKWEGFNNWGGWKVSGTLDDIEDPVVTFSQKYLYDKI